MDHIIVTAENLAAVAATLPPDHAREVVPGCATWGIVHRGGQRGQITVWPSGRAAIDFGADSEWGDWDGRIIVTDDGLAFDASGRLIVTD